MLGQSVGLAAVVPLRAVPLFPQPGEMHGGQPAAQFRDHFAAVAGRFIGVPAVGVKQHDVGLVAIHRAQFGHDLPVAIFDEPF